MISQPMWPGLNELIPEMKRCVMAHIDTRELAYAGKKELENILNRATRC